MLTFRTNKTLIALLFSYSFLWGIGFAQQVAEWDDFSLRVQNGHCVADAQCIYRILDNSNHVLYQTKNETKPSYLGSFHDGHRDFETFQNGVALRHVYHGDVEQYDTNVISDTTSDQQVRINPETVSKFKELQQTQPKTLEKVESKDTISEDEALENSVKSSNDEFVDPQLDALQRKTDIDKPAVHVDTDEKSSNHKENFFDAVGAFLIGGSGVILICSFSLFIYFLPTLIAYKNKNCQNGLVILLVNFFTGWTAIGWIIALVMALWKPPSQANQVVNVLYQTSEENNLLFADSENLSPPVQEE
jgi:hypothetical protein